MTDRFYRLCPDCVERVHRGFKCSCGGDPWDIDKSLDDLLNRIDYAIIVNQARKHRPYNITRTDWTTDKNLTCQTCKKKIPSEERPVYLFLPYKGHSSAGTRCIKCTAKYLELPGPEAVIPKVWFNNG